MSTVGPARTVRLGAVLSRLTAVLVGAGALVFGFIGLREYLATQPDFPHGGFDLLYYDVQLFVLSSPPIDNGRDFPLLLQIARFAAPAVTVYALVEAGRRLAGDVFRTCGRQSGDSDPGYGSVRFGR